MIHAFPTPGAACLPLLLLGLVVGCGESGPTPLATDGICEAEPPGVPFSAENPNLQRQVLVFAGSSDGGDVSVRLARDYREDGEGLSRVWDLTMMTVEVAGQGECVTDVDRLAYENTHHNWADRAEVEIDEIRYRLEMDFTWLGDGDPT